MWAPRGSKWPPKWVKLCNFNIISARDLHFSLPRVPSGMYVTSENSRRGVCKVSSLDCQKGTFHKDFEGKNFTGEAKKNVL